MNKIECTTLFLDVRNFTHLMQFNENNEKFYQLIKKVYDLGEKFVSSFCKSEDYYINSTGDGFLCIFFGENNEIKAYLTALLLQKKLEPYFISFKPWNNQQNETINEKKEGEFFFGIGIESGVVEKIHSEQGNLETYLGNVVNMAARIESLSKEHGRAPVLYGPIFNERIVQKLFNGTSYEELMNTAKNYGANIQDQYKNMNDINSKLLSSYINEHRIKGAENFVPIFRVSPTQLKANNYEIRIIKEKAEFKSIYDTYLSLLHG